MLDAVVAQAGNHSWVSVIRARTAAALISVAILAAMPGAMPSAVADPDVDIVTPDDPPPPAFPIFQLALPDAAPVGQDPTPFTGDAPFASASIRPSDGSTVGVAMPVIITFDAPVGDRAAAEGAIHVSSDPPVPGKFYWMSDSQVRWRPFDF